MKLVLRSLGLGSVSGVDDYCILGHKRAARYSRQESQLPLLQPGRCLPLTGYCHACTEESTTICLHHSWSVLHLEFLSLTNHFCFRLNL